MYLNSHFTHNFCYTNIFTCSYLVFQQGVSLQKILTWAGRGRPARCPVFSYVRAPRSESSLASQRWQWALSDLLSTHRLWWVRRSGFAQTKHKIPSGFTVLFGHHLISAQGPAEGVAVWFGLHDTIWSVSAPSDPDPDPLLMTPLVHLSIGTTLLVKICSGPTSWTDHWMGTRTRVRVRGPQGQNLCMRWMFCFKVAPVKDTKWPQRDMKISQRRAKGSKQT